MVEYCVGQDTVPYDSAEIDSDPDFDSDEIIPDIQKPPLMAEFSCHQFTGGIDPPTGSLPLPFFQRNNSYIPVICVQKGRQRLQRVCPVDHQEMEIPFSPPFIMKYRGVA